MNPRKDANTSFLHRDLGLTVIPLLAVVFLYFATASFLHASPLQEALAEGMAGDWILNEDLSDDPGEKMQEMMAQRGGGRGGGEGGGAGRAGGARDGGRRGGAGGAGGGRGGGGPMGSLAMRSPELHIEASNGNLTLQGAQGPSHTIAINQENPAEAADASELAYWDGPRLVVESTGAEGPPRREVYELVADGGRLVVTLETQLPGAEETFAIRRVFDRAEGN